MKRKFITSIITVLTIFTFSLSATASTTPSHICTKPPPLGSCIQP
ncbi:hypothetical protein [Bacillus sp. Bva_UNVM-123]